jgi:hypothetical protein
LDRTVNVFALTLLKTFYPLSTSLSWPLSWPKEGPSSCICSPPSHPKELWEEAKKMNDKDDSGDYKYKMMGPPWARKVAKIKK